MRRPRSTRRATPGSRRWGWCGRFMGRSRARWGTSRARRTTSCWTWRACTTCWTTWPLLLQQQRGVTRRSAGARTAGRPMRASWRICAATTTTAWAGTTTSPTVQCTFERCGCLFSRPLFAFPRRVCGCDEHPPVLYRSVLSGPRNSRSLLPVRSRLAVPVSVLCDT